MSLALVALMILFAPVLALAGEADVIAVEVSATDGGYRVSATVRHADEGWDHYADAFEVLAPDGTVLATRTLAHPHVDEQPFTRSVRVEVPDGIDTIGVRAKDSVHGLGGAIVSAPLPGR